MTIEHLPPHDVGAEEATLGAVLIDSLALNACAVARLAPGDFFREKNAWVYEAAEACMADGQAVTIQTVAHEMARRGTLDDAGGEPYLARLASDCLTPIGVESHIRIVQNCARLRRIISSAGDIAQRAYEGGEASSVIEGGLGALGALLTDRDTGMEKLGYSDLKEHEGAQWHIPVLDRYTMGLAPGQLTIIAGASGEGKSMLAAQIARNVASQGERVAIFTMEMANREYEARMAHALAPVRKRYSRYDDELTPVELGLLAEGQRKIAEWDIHSSARPNITAAMIASSVRLLNAERHVGLVVVDYLQLMGMPDDKDSEASNLKSITRALKNLSMEIGCHVIVVSQLNRSSMTEMRTGGSKMECLLTGEKYTRPFKEALMGGAVENDADLVVMLANHKNCPQPHQQIVIAKNRNGRDGDGMMFPDFSLCRFTSYTEDECYRVAGADLQLAHRLLMDQGWRKE